MAKNLKPGERVIVRKSLRFKHNSETYQQGLKSVKVGQVGEVVGSAAGRSTIVDFGGKRAVISTQNLNRVEEQSPVETPVSAQPAATPAQEEPSGSGEIRVVEQPNPQFITYIANRLIMSGRIKVDADTVVEIRLSDLLAPVQKQIQALIDAKLGLGPESSPVQSARRGRRARQAKVVPASKTKRNPGRESQS